MAINENVIKNWYSNKSEENRATHSKADSIEFIFTKKILEKYVNKQSNVIEIGCGTGYYGMFLADKCKKYTGIDLTPENIELFNEKIGEANFKNITTAVGDATNLENINNNEYNIVLVLGPMYHLPPNERNLVFLEAKRICKDNGIIIFAYINKLGVYLYGALSFPDIYPNEKAFDHALLKEVDDLHPDKFYYSTPEKMDDCAKEHGLEKIKNVGVSFIFNRNQINDMDEKKYRKWLEYLEYLCDNECCTGLSNHCLLICKR
jgi:ubiquinone/menaquinone biosynthesis C-methylase UbiE